MPDSSTPAEAADQMNATEQIVRSLQALRRGPNSPKLHSKLVQVTGIDLDPSGFQLLLRLHEVGEVRLTDLANCENVDLSVISRKVRQLEDAGYVERRTSPDDGRAAVLRLSASGSAGMERLREQRNIVLEGIFSAWSATDIEQLAALLDRFVEDSQRYLDENA